MCFKPGSMFWKHFLICVRRLYTAFGRISTQPLNQRALPVNHYFLLLPMWLLSLYHCLVGESVSEDLWRNDILPVSHRDRRAGVESGLRVCTWGTGEQERGCVGYKPELLLIKAGFIFHMFCAESSAIISSRTHQEGTSWFAVLCGQHTLIAMDCATVEKSTSWTELAPRLLVKLGVWKVSWMRFWRTCCGFSSSLTWDYTFYVADYRLTATAVWLGYFVWNGTWGT